MAEICYLLLSNGLLASVLAMCVWCIGKWVRYPALLHLLWLLVLLRLLAPPMLTVDLSGPRDWLASAVQRGTEQHAALAERAIGDRAAVIAAITTALQCQRLSPVRSVIPESEDLAATKLSGSIDDAVASAATDILGGLRYLIRQTSELLGKLCHSAVSVLFPIWCIGTLTCLAIQIRSAISFGRSMKKDAYTSRIWQQRAEKIAKQMELRSCPQLLLVRATISPMLWGFGSGTRILFPEQLLAKLSANAQATLLAHELAHYRRGDQWVRLVELVATALFWWHPVLWWARTEIEKAEEHCCDAWAIRFANGNRRTYAEALLAAVDFVCSSSLPPVASGVTHSSFLRERVYAIMRHRLANGRTLIPDGYPSILALAAFVLIPYPAFWSNTFNTVNAPLIQAASPSLSTLAAPATIIAPAVAVAKSEQTVETPEAAKVAFGIDASHRATFTNQVTGVRRNFGVGRVAIAEFSHDQQWLAVGTLSGNLQLIAADTGETKRTFDLGHAAVSSVTFAPNDDMVAIGTRDGLCKLVDLHGARAEEVQRRKRGATVKSVQFSEDGRFATVAWAHRSNLTVEVWNLISGRVTTLPAERASFDAAISTSPTLRPLLKVRESSSGEGYRAKNPIVSSAKARPSPRPSPRHGLDSSQGE